MSRTKNQRPKTRGATQSEKRRPNRGETDPFDRVEEAIDALDAIDEPGHKQPRADSGLPPIPQRPDRKRRPGRAATPLPVRADTGAVIEIEIDTSAIEREDPEEIDDDDIAGEEDLAEAAELDAVIAPLDQRRSGPIGQPQASLEVPRRGPPTPPASSSYAEPDARRGPPTPPAPTPAVSPRPAGAYAEFGLSSDPAELSVKKRMPLPPAGYEDDPLAEPPAADDDDDRDEASEADAGEQPQLPALAIAVHDTAALVGSAEHVIAEAGHAVVIAASGPSGLERVAAAVREGVDVLFVGIPGGEPLIDVAYAAEHRPVIIASVAGAPDAAVARAVEVGADLVALRPHELVHLAPVLLAAARLAKPVEDDDEVLGTLRPYEDWKGVVEQQIERAARHGYPLALALFSLALPSAPPPGVPGILRARAGNALMHVLRDIDVATEDRDRFLVLMPFTTIAAAGEVARRMIAAVAAGDPVVMAGRAFAPAVIGAVVGGDSTAGPLTLARLVREASDALEQARRDGAELAVRP